PGGLRLGAAQRDAGLARGGRVPLAALGRPRRARAPVGRADPRPVRPRARARLLRRDGRSRARRRRVSVDVETLRHGLSITLERTAFSGLGPKVEGKVRDSYLPGDGRRVLVTTDRISAFDRVLGTLPFKGQVLNQLSAWWFERTADVAPNHLRSVPDPSVTVAIECEPLPVEWVMRAYLTGVTSTSVWTHYEIGRAHV